MVKVAPGVYEVRDSKIFPFQIVVTRELDPTKHAGLRILSREASEEDIEIFLGQASKETSPGELSNIDAILQVSVSANKATYESLKRRNPGVCEAMKTLMRDEIEEERKDARYEEKKEMAITLRKEGMDVDFIVKVTKVAKDVVEKWIGVQTV